MGTEYVFICEDCNEIYELGKWRNAKVLVPYLKNKHDNCQHCGSCSEYDINKDWDWVKGTLYTGHITACDYGTPHYCSWSFNLINPKWIPYQEASFWEEFRHWVENGKRALIRHTITNFKVKFGLLQNPDWWKEDEKIDKEIKQSLSRINHFLDRIQLLDESTVDEIIDEVINIEN
jgi:hypothetical protein